MMLLGIHIIGISVIVAVIWNLAFSAGKQAGLRQAELEQEVLEDASGADRAIARVFAG